MTDKPPLDILCLDPGLVSGLGILHYDLDVHPAVIRKVISFEGDLGYIGEQVDHFLEDHNPDSSEVIAERFTITVRTAKNSQAPWSLECIGMVKWLIHDRWGLDPDETLILQQPGDAKRMITNDILRKMDVWHRGGAGHANDALRHGLYRYARHGVRDMFTS